MSNRNEDNRECLSKIQSELYAIIETIINLEMKYKDGQLKDNFFQNTIRNAINDLIKLNFELQDNNIQLSEFLEEMKYNKEYFKAIDIINRISSLHFSSESSIDNSSLYPETVRSTFFGLPGLSSEITSLFITLMDALKIGNLSDNQILINLLKDLKFNFDKFPGLEDLKFQFDILYKKVLNDPDKLFSNQQHRESIGHELYSIFNEFQKKLKPEV